MAKNKGTTPQNNWWEFYIVRYSVGTIIGALLFNAVASNSFLKPMLFGFDVDVKGSEFLYLGLLGFYGLAFCYLASAPILVFHATRFVHQSDSEKNTPKVLAALSFIFSILLIYCLTSNSVYASVGSALLLLFCGQCVLIWKTLNSSQENYMFYKGLTKARNKAEPEFLLSYRHLREHGNSFLIILMEFFLAFLMYLSDKLLMGIQTPEIKILAFGFMVVLWISPASFCWFIGTRIEWKLYQSANK